MALAAARLSQRRGDYDVAEAAALGLVARDSGPVGLEARALVARVRIARARYQEALEIAAPGLLAAAGEPRARAALAEAAGLARFYLGDLDGAGLAFTAVADAASELGDRALAGRACSLAGMVAQQRGQLDEAVRGYSAALEHARAVSDVHGAAIYAANLGAALADRADHAAALAPTAEAIRDLSRLGRTAELAGALFNRGVLLIALGDLAAAERAAERARAASRAPAAPLMQGYASLLEGDLARRQARLPAAVAAYQAGERLFVDAGAAREAELARMNLADALSEGGDFAGAAAALARCRGAADRDFALRAELSRARLQVADAATPASARRALAATLEDARGAAAHSGRRDLAFRLDVLAAALLARAGDPLAVRPLGRARAGWDAISAATPEESIAPAWPRIPTRGSWPRSRPSSLPACPQEVPCPAPLPSGSRRPAPRRACAACSPSTAA